MTEVTNQEVVSAEIVFDLCTCSIKVTPSSDLSIDGWSIGVEGPLGTIRKVDKENLSTSASFEIPLQKVRGAVPAGDYSITVYGVEGDTSYETVYTLNFCVPSFDQIIDVSVDCLRGAILVTDATPYVVSGVKAQLDYDYKLVWPTLDGANYEETGSFVPVEFSGNIYTGGYTLDLSVVATWDIDGISIVKCFDSTKSFDVNCRFNICPALCEIDKLVDKISSGCAQEEKVEAQETLATLSSYMLAYQAYLECGKDPGSIIEKIEALIGISCCDEITTPRLIGTGSGGSPMSLSAGCGDIRINGGEISDKSYFLCVGPGSTNYLSIKVKDETCSKTWEVDFDASSLVPEILEAIKETEESSDCSLAELIVQCIVDEPCLQKKIDRWVAVGLADQCPAELIKKIEAGEGIKIEVVSEQIPDECVECEEGCEPPSITCQKIVISCEEKKWSLDASCLGITSFDGDCDFTATWTVKPGSKINRLVLSDGAFYDAPSGGIDVNDPAAIIAWLESLGYESSVNITDGVIELTILGTSTEPVEVFIDEAATLVPKPFVVSNCQVTNEQQIQQILNAICDQTPEPIDLFSLVTGRCAEVINLDATPAQNMAAIVGCLEQCCDTNTVADGCAYVRNARVYVFENGESYLFSVTMDPGCEILSVGGFSQPSGVVGIWGDNVQVYPTNVNPQEECLDSYSFSVNTTCGTICFALEEQVCAGSDSMELRCFSCPE